jgi:glycosyltransferase involved in cell wall biosynthesis
VTDDAPLLFDVTRLVWRRWKGRLPTGIDRVCLAYLRHFGPRSQAVIQHRRFRRIIGREASRDLFALLETPKRFRTRLPLGALRHWRGMSGAGEERLYLNIGHTGLNAPGFAEWVSRTDVRPVYFVHDLIPITHPEFCRPGETEKHVMRMQTVLRTAAGVIGNSQATLDELAFFATEQGLPVPPSVAAWLGTDTLAVPSRATPPDRPTFVVLSTIEARKNHMMLLDIWSRLIDRLGDRAPRLLIIGQRGWEAEDVFEKLDRDTKLRGHVIELNDCSDADLARHMASARALLFPSLAEGFGLPLVEALGSGVPVIASDVPVFREIGGDIPKFVHATASADWVAAILDYAQDDSASRGAQIERMQGFRAPTWDDHFKTVEAFLATLG